MRAETDPRRPPLIGRTAERFALTMDQSRNFATKLMAVAIAATVALLAVAACSGNSSPQPIDGGLNSGGVTPATVPASGPDAFLSGEEIFNANCSACHGVGAAGTNAGPPLVHEIYEPGHHPDFSIRNAVNQGVMQHHWFFGNMPPVAGLSADDVEHLICYIREAQRDGGIFEEHEYGGPC